MAKSKSKSKAISVRQCSGCSKSAKSAKLPPGWRVFGGSPMCPDCKCQRYVVRAVVVPVKAPLTMTWAEFDQRLIGSLHACRHLANWAVSELYARDVRPGPADMGLPKFPQVNLYRALTCGVPDSEAYRLAAYWVGAKRTASSILNQVQALYVRERAGVLLHGNRSLRAYRHDELPLPIHNQTWELSYDDQGRPVVTLPLPALGGDPGNVDLLLDVPPRYWRQADRLAMLAQGQAERCEAAIYRRRASAGCHRHCSQGRGESQTRFYRAFVKLVGWFPRRKAEEADGRQHLTLYTDPNAFWVCESGRDDGANLIWRENGDHIRRLAAMHSAYLRRIAEDKKHERRTLHRSNLLAQMNDAVSERCRKYHKRIEAFIGQTTASVVKLAQKEGAGIVWYCDNDRSYVGSFPWSRLREELGRKLDEVGVKLSGYDMRKDDDHEGDS